MSVYSTRVKKTKVPAIATIRKVKEVQPTQRMDTVNYAYEIAKSYRNYLSYPIVITDRNNLSVMIPSQRQHSQQEDKELHIDILIKHSADVIFDYTHILDDVDDTSPAELQLIKQVVKNHRVSVKYGRNYISFSYRVDDRLLQRNDYSVYLDQVDTVVSRDGYHQHMVHPYSQIGQALILNQRSDMFHYRILINDPHFKFGDRYININGQVYPVYRTTDNSVKPGVYVYTDKTVCYTFEEADTKLKLFNTETLAKNLGIPEEHVKAQIEQQTLQYRKESLDKEQQLAELKNQHSVEELERKRQHEQLKLELTQRESDYKKLELEYKRLTAIENQRLQELKHELEMRSANRKDTSEFMKWLPALIGGAAALFGLLL